MHYKYWPYYEKFNREKQPMKTGKQALDSHPTNLDTH